MSRDTAFIAPRTGPTRNSSPFGLALLRQLVALLAMERSRAISSVLIRRTARFYSRTRRCLAIIGDVFTYRHNGKQYFGVCSCVGGWAAIGLAGRLTNPTDGLGAVRGYIRASTATPRWVVADGEGRAGADNRPGPLRRVLSSCSGRSTIGNAP